MAGPGEMWQEGHRLIPAPSEDNSSDIRQTIARKEDQSKKMSVTVEGLERLL